MNRTTRLLLVALTLTAVPLGGVAAQHLEADVYSDRDILEATLRDVRDTVHDVFQWVGRQVGDAAFLSDEVIDDLERAHDIDAVEILLGDVRHRVHALRVEAEHHGDRALQRRLAQVEDRLDELIDDIEDIERIRLRDAYRTRDTRVVVVHDRKKKRDKDRDRGRRDRDRDRDRDRHYGFGSSFGDHDWDAGVASPHLFGLFGPQPFYAPLPALRYNRVEGFVLGLDVSPLELGSSRQAKIYGQVGYAFALDDIRYQAGLETQIGRTRRERARLGLKLGAAYHENTTTDDTWKIDPVENALAAFFLRHDFYDYYETATTTAASPN